MGRYRNPILPGCHPDPSVCRVGDEYFLVTSTFEYLPGLPVHRSVNLVDWELIGHVVHDELDFTDLPSSGGLFAPTIRWHGGRFFVVCTLVHGSESTRHFAMTATDPGGRWSGPRWFDGVPGIDPSLTFDGDRVWLCGTRLADPGLWPGQTDVWLRELDRDTLQPIGEERLIWHGALEGAMWAEGPHILPRPGGGWMLLAAEGGTARDHAICVAYADAVDGPYTGDPGNPRLTHRDLGGTSDIVNVGHADLVDTPGGSTWAVLLATHADGGLDSLLGRQTHLVPVAWEDRRPVFAPGVGRVRRVMEHDDLVDQAPPITRRRDGFTSLDPQWNGVRRLPSTFARPRGGALHLTAGEVPADGFLGRRLPETRATARVRVHVTAGLRAGLLLRTSDDDWAEVSVDPQGIVSAAISARASVRVAGAVQVAAASVDLAIALDGFTATALADGSPVASFDVSDLSTSRAGGFLGCWIGPFAVGVGEAVFEQFELHASAPPPAVDDVPHLV
jgi:alpha-N-arabinofuranosidase